DAALAVTAFGPRVFPATCHEAVPRLPEPAIRPIPIGFVPETIVNPAGRFRVTCTFCAARLPPFVTFAVIVKTVPISIDAGPEASTVRPGGDTEKVFAGSTIA